MGKRRSYEELLQREEELTKRNREIWEQTFRLRCERDKNTSKLASIRKSKLKYYTEKMNKCLSDKSFTIVKIERFYEECGCATVRCTEDIIPYRVWFYYKNCSLDDLMKEDVKIIILKGDLDRLIMNIYPLGIGGKCLEEV